jgi:tetratricopeptide (TPR) repeat protein
MSLLLDALKKAALEKQRRSQSQDVAAEPVRDTLVEAQSAAVTRKGLSGSSGADLLSSWAQSKRAKLTLHEHADFSEPAQAPLAQEDLAEPAAELASAKPAALISPDESEALADRVALAHREALADRDAIGGDSEVSGNREAQGNSEAPGDSDEAASCAACEFIDISDLDFAALVGYIEPETASIQPTALDVPQDSRQVNSATQPDTVAQITGASISTPLAKADEAAEPALAAAPLLAAAPPLAAASERQSKSPDASTDSPSPQSAAAEPSTQAFTPTGKAPAQFSHDAGKQALGALLSKSQQIANRNRRRLIAMYCMLLITAAALVGIYYYLLHRNDTPLVLAPAMQSSEQLAQEPPENAASDANAVSEVDAEAPITVEPTPQTNDAQRPNSTAEISTSTPAASAPSSNSAPEQPQFETAPSQPASSPSVVINRDPISGLAPVVTRIDGGVEAAAPAAPVGTTAVLAYQPAAEDDLASALERGYAAYEAGDLDTAAQAYQLALSLEPHHRDALLGAAAVALQKGQANEALNYYQQRLARAPTDDYAHAGMLAIGAQAAANPQLESELTRLLLAYPEAAHLHYLQGTLYARRQQWAAAQLAFLAAWQRDNQNPNVACDLAIAFDHLQVPDEAKRFYSQALSLSKGQAISFSAAAIRARLTELEGSGARR